MKVKAKYDNCTHLKESSFKEIGYSPKTSLRLTIGKNYEVYDSNFENNFFLQIINDLDMPSWLPICFFEVFHTGAIL